MPNHEVMPTFSGLEAHSNRGPGLQTLLLHLPLPFHPALWTGWYQVVGHLRPKVRAMANSSGPLTPLDGLLPGHSWDLRKRLMLSGLFGQGILGCWAHGKWSRRREGHRLQLDTSLLVLQNPSLQGGAWLPEAQSGSSKQRGHPLPRSQGGSANQCSRSKALSSSYVYFQALNV